jgi:hypothetical protein
MENPNSMHEIRRWPPVRPRRCLWILRIATSPGRVFANRDGHPAVHRRHCRRATVCAGDPPLRDDFLDVQFSHKRSPLWLGFSGYILNPNGQELGGHSLLRVREIVVPIRQISPSDKPPAAPAKFEKAIALLPESVLSTRVNAGACAVRRRGFLLLDRTYRGSSCKAAPVKKRAVRWEADMAMESP